MTKRVSQEKRPYYHNKKTGQSKWKPPRKKMNTHTHPNLPRSPNHIFAYGSNLDDDDDDLITQDIEEE